MQLPITTRTVTCPNAWGSDSSPVEVVVNGCPTFLSDSAQYLLEYGVRVCGTGCMTILPSLRSDLPDAEHLSEFTHAELEIPGDLNAMIEAAESYIRHLSQTILVEFDSSTDPIGPLDHLALPSRGFPRITFREALESLRELPGSIEGAPGARRLTRAGEQRLIEQHGGLVWVTHFEERAVPFYQAPSSDSGHSLCADLLFGMGEVIGGGQRHRDSRSLLASMDQHGVKPADYEWYSKMRDIAPVTTSGFGMGVERFLMWVLSCRDIRDVPLLSRVGQSQTWPDAVTNP
jgi:aspartyl/asparaginyl-tRNA synthetase